MTFPFPAFGPFDPEDLPEPIRSMLQRGIDRMEEAADNQHALAEDKINKFWQFMNDMEPEQLATFREILLALLHSPKPTWLANRMEGQADAIFRTKFPELCRNCGRATCGSSAPHLANPGKLTVVPEQPKFGSFDSAFDMKIDPRLQQEVENNLNTQAAMAEYNVVPNPEGPTKFKCGNCGVGIVSLEDRMLREPGIGGCSGCMVKSRQG